MKSTQRSLNPVLTLAFYAVLGSVAALAVGCGSGDPLSSKEKASTSEAIEFMNKAQKASSLTSRFSQGMSVSTGLEIEEMAQMAVQLRSRPNPRVGMPATGSEPRPSVSTRPSRPSTPASDEGNLRFDNCKQELPRNPRVGTPPTASQNMDMTLKVTGNDCPIEMTLTMRGTGQRPNYISMTMKANSEEFKTRYDFTSFNFTMEGDLMSLSEAMTGISATPGTGVSNSTPATNASITFKMSADSPSMGSTAWETKLDISRPESGLVIAQSGKVGFNKKSATYRISQTYNSDHQLTASEAYVNDEKLNTADYERLASVATPSAGGMSSGGDRVTAGPSESTGSSNGPVSPGIGFPSDGVSDSDETQIGG